MHSETPNPKHLSRRSLDNLLFKILITLTLVSLPGGVYYLYGFNTGVITALCEIIFLVMATREDLQELKSKFEIKPKK